MKSTDSKTILSPKNVSIKEKYSVIGISSTKIDALEKVTGVAKYGADISFPNMLFGKILRSQYAHAKILKIDTSEAKKLPGVKAVITAYDMPDVLYGIYTDDQRAFAKDKVKYCGDPIAAVAATDMDIAEDALDLIKVEYSPLPVVLDPEKAMETDQLLVHDQFSSNIIATRKIRKGDVDKAFKKSDFIFENVYQTSMIEHCSIETHVAVADYESSDRLTIWSPTQAPFVSRTLLSRILEMPLSSIRIIQTSLGGAFGGKQDLMAEPSAAMLSKKTRRPVKVICDRMEEFTASTVRHPFKLYFKTSFRKDGKILARKIRIIQDCGAYNDLGEGVLRYATLMAAGPYSIDNVWIDSYLVYTNKNIGTVMRGVGVPQVNFAGERQLDIASRKMNIDPFDLRLKNVLRDGDRTANGQKIFHVGMEKCLRVLREESGYDQYIKQNRKKNTGIGLSAMIYDCSAAGVKDYSSAIVKFNEDGSVNVFTGTPDAGQGSRTVLNQIAAEELGVKYEDVWTSMADTDYSPLDKLGFAGSRVSFMAGHAIRNAAIDAKRQIINYIYRKENISKEDISFQEGWVFFRNRKIRLLRDVVKEMTKEQGKIIIGEGSHNTLSVPMNKENGLSNTVELFLFGASLAEVEVDTNTGKVKVLNIWQSHDVGKVINPLTIQGQVEGGVAQALGFALSEAIIHDENGKVRNPNFLDYKILTALDMPKIYPILVEIPDPKGPFGIKGIGENTAIPGAAAIANAVKDAVNIDVARLPMTPEYIYFLLRNEENKNMNNL